MVLRHVYCYGVGFRMITFPFLLFLYFHYISIYWFSVITVFPTSNSVVVLLCYNSVVSLTSNHLFSWRYKAEPSVISLYLPFMVLPMIILLEAILNYFHFQNSMWWLITWWCLTGLWGLPQVELWKPAFLSFTNGSSCWCFVLASQMKLWPNQARKFGCGQRFSKKIWLIRLRNRSSIHLWYWRSP